MIREKKDKALRIIGDYYCDKRAMQLHSDIDIPSLKNCIKHQTQKFTQF